MFSRLSSLLTANCIIFIGTSSFGILIDDFSQGEILLTGPETVTQSNLSLLNTAGGERVLTAVQQGDTVSISSGSVSYVSNNAYGFSLGYGITNPLAISTTNFEVDRLVIRFNNSSIPAARLADLYINLPPTGSANGLSFGNALESVGENGMIEFLLEDIPTDFQIINEIRIQFARAFGVGGFDIEEIFLAGPPISGDFDRNGIVNLEDYATWNRLYQGSSKNGSIVESYLTADANYDGVVDAADYTIWRDAMLSTSGTSIPEPSAFLLFTFSAIVTLLLPKQRS